MNFLLERKNMKFRSFVMLLALTSCGSGQNVSQLKEDIDPIGNFGTLIVNPPADTDLTAAGIGLSLPDLRMKINASTSYRLKSGKIKILLDGNIEDFDNVSMNTSIEVEIKKGQTTEVNLTKLRPSVHILSTPSSVLKPISRSIFPTSAKEISRSPVRLSPI